jgi:hypothetical protein
MEERRIVLDLGPEDLTDPVLCDYVPIEWPADLIGVAGR